jgi:hypothetical protein
MSLSGALKSIENGVCSYTISRLCLFYMVLLLAQYYTMCVTAAQLCRSRKRTQFVATDMTLFDTLKSSKSKVCSYTILRLWLFQAVQLLAQR